MSATAAYVVDHQHEGILLTHTLFTHDKLLTARKAAMSHVEKLLAELWQRGDLTTTIEVRLIDVISEPDASETSTVALVYQLDLPIMSVRPRSEAKAVLLSALDQLHEEFMYYQTLGHSMGFGSFLCEVEEASSSQTFAHLYDATSYFNELLCRYNSQHRDPEAPELFVIATYDDRHYCAGQLIDELVG